jgi:hypothetical protein
MMFQLLVDQNSVNNLIAKFRSYGNSKLQFFVWYRMPLLLHLKISSTTNIVKLQYVDYIS